MGSKQRHRREYNRAWRAANGDRVKERAREYREKNRERIRAYHAEWRARNRPSPKREPPSEPERLERTRRTVDKYRSSPKGILARRRRELRAYGITPEHYDALFAKQSGVCAVCGHPETRRRRDRVEYLTVDHCHETGRIRGLLCRSCNRGLGLLGDTAAALSKALHYLSR